MQLAITLFFSLVAHTKHSGYGMKNRRCLSECGVMTSREE